MPQNNSENFVPLEASLTEWGYLSNLYQAENLGEFFNALFILFIVIGGVIAVLRIVYAGYKYMTTEAISSKGEAKRILTQAIIGLVLLLSTVLILNQINEDLLRSPDDLEELERP